MKFTSRLLACCLVALPASAMAQPLVRAPNAPIVTAEAKAAAIALSKTIWSIINGEPNFDDMSPDLQTALKAQLTDITAMVKALGLLNTADYQGVGPGGVQGFKGKFVHGEADVIIALDKEGKITTLQIRPTA